MSGIDRCFAHLREKGESALVPFLMAGDPDLETTRALLMAAQAAGADLVELGVPFSDPTADGPALQRSAARALAAGTSLPRILEMVAELDGELKIPLILFGYYNPIFRYGPERCAGDAARAGVDGFLVVDLPPEEAEELRRPARAAGLDQIFLVAPTSDQRRLEAVRGSASGFVYYVSMTGVTGSRTITPADVRPGVERVRAVCRLPVGGGFGVTGPQEAAAVAQFADAVIVGSALMRLVERAGDRDAAVESVAAFVAELKTAVRGASRHANRGGDGPAGC